MSETATLLAALRGHYIGPEPLPGGVFLSEVQVPISGQAGGTRGGRVRRADAVYLGFVHSRGIGVDVHELKVSRADFQTELDKPAKAESWWRYSTRFWIVSPGPHITPPDLLPPGWGLMCPKARGRRFETLVKPAEREPDVDLALLIEVAKRLDTLRADAASTARHQTAFEWQQRYSALQDERTSVEIPPHVKRRLAVLDRLEKLAGVRFSDTAADDASWVRQQDGVGPVAQWADAIGVAMRLVKLRDQAAAKAELAGKNLANAQRALDDAASMVNDIVSACSSIAEETDHG